MVNLKKCAQSRSSLIMHSEVFINPYFLCTYRMWLYQLFFFHSSSCFLHYSFLQSLMLERFLCFTLFPLIFFFGVFGDYGQCVRGFLFTFEEDRPLRGLEA